MIATLLIVQPTVLKRRVTEGNTWDGSLLHRVVLCGGVDRPLFTCRDIIRMVFDKDFNKQRFLIIKDNNYLIW